MKSLTHYLPRPPRYPAIDVRQIELIVMRLQDGAPEETLHDITLLELSRRGARFSSEHMLPLNAELRVQIGLRDGPCYVGRAVVRWNLPQPPKFVCGCVFDEPIPWEVLGEFLLRGAVAAL
jgi:hypothetical protein